MINSVQGVSFKGDIAGTQNLINSPGQYSAPAYIGELPPDTFEMEGEEKKKSSGLKALVATLVVGLATFAGLGYAVKKGHLGKVEINEADGFFKKLWPRTKNLGHTIGEKAESCWNTICGWFGKGGKKATDATTK